MKKLLLAAGGRSGTLLLAPLYKALKKKPAYLPVVMLAAPEGAEPISRDLAASLGIGDASHAITLPIGTPVEQLAAAMPSQLQNSVFDLNRATLSSKLDSLFEASWRDGSH